MAIRKFVLRSFALLFFVQVYTINAQDTEKGMNDLSMGQMKSARQIFEASLLKDTNNLKAQFGLGEYYYKMEKYDSAQLMFDKLLLSMPDDPFNKIAVAKIWLQTGKGAEADLKFAELAKKNKKNQKVQLAIAKAYIEGKSKNTVQANLYVANARAISSKSAEAFLISGKISKLDQKFNEATGQFEQAINFDSTLCEGYIYLSDVYKQARNYRTCLNLLNRALGNSPNYWPLYKKIGEIHYELAQYKEAVEAYGKYLAQAEYVSDDEERYTYCLFFNKEYDNALKEINRIAINKPGDHVLKRLTSYIYFEKGEFSNALGAIEDFFAKVEPKKIIPLDYEYYGKTLSQLNMDSLAIINFKMAIELDTTRFSLNEDIAKAYGKLKLYGESASYYQKVIGNKENPLVSDFFMLGKAYYFAGSMLYDSIPSDSLMKHELLLKGDSIFEKITVKSPTSYIGYLWRGRVNLLLDPESTLGLAKPHYEKALELFIANPTKFKKELIESYSFLGIYYSVKEDYPMSKENWDKILVMDPENANAKNALEDIKTRQKK